MILGRHNGKPVNPPVRKPPQVKLRPAVGSTRPGAPEPGGCAAASVAIISGVLGVVSLVGTAIYYVS